MAASSTYYVLAYNSGTTDATNVNITLEPVNPKLVAVNAGGAAFISQDGVTWGGSYTTGLSIANDIAFANGLYVAVGQDGTYAGLSTSVDGVTWTKQNFTDASAALFTRIQANPAGQFLTPRYYGATVDIFTSADGLAWNGPHASGIGGGSIGPAWTGGNWFIASSSLNPIRKSSDGITWNTSTASSMYQSNTLIGVNGYLIAGGGAPLNANKLTVTSSDGGTTFGSLVNLVGTTHYIQAFAANPTTFRVLSVGSGASAQASYSDNYGSTWTIASGTGVNSFRAACYWREGFLIGDNTGAIYSSSDGAAFTFSGSAGTSEIRGIAYNGAP
ncbi:hypothetical protein MASR2M78_14620 [Treponema sp.]